ncbi:MAG: SpoIID/LytB domain-containing protein [Flavobacteriales bacterium]|nr:MAG: SpoIID/LytB domain-containing protein [Flavobacteriales bacterium]
MRHLMIFFIFAGLSLTFAAKGSNIELRIRLYDAPEKITVSVKEGLYSLVAADPSGNFIDTIWDIHEDDPVRIFYIRRVGTKVEINMKGLGTHTFQEIWLVPHPQNPDPSFIIQGTGRDRWYQDKLHFFVIDNDGKKELTTVNQVAIEKYVAGVVESEGGRFNQLEYFKAQAVLARTFAIKNLRKHIRHRYNLRDDVSSQVYHSRAYLQNATEIKFAALATKDTILVDEDGDILLGLFHANSGGQTANAGDVWSRDISYLRSKPDPFSVGQTSYSWTKKIPKADVMKFVTSQIGSSYNPGDLHKALINFQQENRKSHFEFQNKKIKLTQFRTRFGLRSTFFIIQEEGDFYVFKGRGFGHGVGLSQDGAINMSASGYSYKEILYFYFDKTQLENIFDVLDNNESLRKMVIENAHWLDHGNPSRTASP